MTTFISKDADFSGGRLVDYDCPILDAGVCAWLGGGLSDAVRNFGTGPDLTVVGSPTPIDDLFLRVSGAAYLQTEQLRTAESTVVVVYRNVDPAANGVNRPSILSNDTGTAALRNGLSLYSGPGDGYAGAASISHVNQPANTLATLAQTLAVGARNVLAPQFFVAEEARQVSGLSKLTISTLTIPAETKTLSLGGSSTPPMDISQGPYRIGASYRNDAAALIGAVDVAFVAIIPRVLSAAEKQTLYNSVKRRFAAYGITI